MTTLSADRPHTQDSGDPRYERLREVIADYHAREENLIQILHAAQELFGYLPHDVMTFVATELDLPYSRLAGVVTFYSLFSTEPTGRHTIHVCLGTACYVRGGRKVLDKLTETLGVEPGQTTADRRFSLGVMRCIGACGLAPAVSIDDNVHKRVNPNRLGDVLKKYQ